MESVPQDYTHTTSRDLARVRGDKRTFLQLLRRMSIARLADFVREHQRNPSGNHKAHKVDIAFLQDCKEACIINDRRLGDPDMDHLVALKALCDDVKALDDKYRPLGAKFGNDFEELVEQERSVKFEQDCRESVGGLGHAIKEDDGEE